MDAGEKTKKARQSGRKGIAMRVLIYLLKKYWFAVVVVAMVAIFFGIISSNQKLAVYTKDDRAEYTVIKEEETVLSPVVAQEINDGIIHFDSME